MCQDLTQRTIDALSCMPWPRTFPHLASEMWDTRERKHYLALPSWAMW
jgi:hypothetical protein